MTDTRKKFLFIIVILLVGVMAYYYYTRDETEPEPAPPMTEEVSGWETATGPRYSFQYPAGLDTSYIEVLDWPPQVAVLEEEFSCLEAGEESERAGRTEAVTISDRQYCRTTIVEGAAGSVYTQYAYAFPYDGNMVILAFSTRAPQCGNFDEPERSECESELAATDIDALADSVAETFRLEE